MSDSNVITYDLQRWKPMKPVQNIYYPLSHMLFLHVHAELPSQRHCMLYIYFFIFCAHLPEGLHTDHHLCSHLQG